MKKFKVLKHDLEIVVNPNWGSNNKLILLPKKGSSTGKKWKWNGSLESTSIDSAIIVDYKGSTLHFWIRDGKAINYGDGINVELISIREKI